MDEITVANILKSNDSLDPETGKRDLHLPYGLGFTDEEVEQSREVFKKILRNHAEKVRRTCKQRNWSLKATRIVAIGGTSTDIEDELKEVFGNVTVLANSKFCNALGYLRSMCSKLNLDIPMPHLKEDGEGEEQTSEKKNENTVEESEKATALAS